MHACVCVCLCLCVLSIFVIATDPLLSTNSGTEATWGQDEHTGIPSAPGIPSNEQVSSCMFTSFSFTYIMIINILTI